LHFCFASPGSEGSTTRRRLLSRLARPPEHPRAAQRDAAGDEAGADGVDRGGVPEHARPKQRACDEHQQRPHDVGADVQHQVPSGGVEDGQQSPYTS